MSLDYQVFLGATAALLGVIGYALYFRSIFRGETKPHFFTWSVYFLVDIIVFTAQVLNGAGAGSWVTLTGLIGTFCVSILALRYGHRQITWSDWASFAAALLAIVLWRITDSALTAVVIACVINFLALYPTYRKVFFQPYEESFSIWIFDIIRFSLGIAALQTLSMTTALFPAALVLGNVLLILLIWLRRRQLNTAT